MLTLILFSTSALCFIYDKIVAVVNDDVITSSEVNKLLRPIYEQYKEAFSGDKLRQKMAKAQGEALEILMENKLLYQEALKYKVEADKDEIDMKINEIKARFSSEQEFFDALESDDMTVEKYKEQIRQQIMTRKILGYFVTSRIVVTPDEVEEYYNSHIEDFYRVEKVKFHLITFKDTVEGETLKKAKEIAGLLDDGKTVTQIKKQFEEDKYLSVKEDMGFYQRGQLLSQIEKNSFTLEIGEHSDPFAIDDEMYIVILTDRMNKGTALLKEVFLLIENKLTYDKITVKKAEFIKQLKEKAYISYK